MASNNRPGYLDGALDQFPRTNPLTGEPFPAAVLVRINEMSMPERHAFLRQLEQERLAQDAGSQFFGSLFQRQPGTLSDGTITQEDFDQALDGAEPTIPELVWDGVASAAEDAWDLARSGLERYGESLAQSSEAKLGTAKLATDGLATGSESLLEQLGRAKLQGAKAQGDAAESVGNMAVSAADDAVTSVEEFIRDGAGTLVEKQISPPRYNSEDGLWYNRSRIVHRNQGKLIVNSETINKAKHPSLLPNPFDSTRPYKLVNDGAAIPLGIFNYDFEKKRVVVKLRTPLRRLYDLVENQVDYEQGKPPVPVAWTLFEGNEEPWNTEKYPVDGDPAPGYKGDETLLFPFPDEGTAIENFNRLVDERIDKSGDEKNGLDADSLIEGEPPDYAEGYELDTGVVRGSEFAKIRNDAVLRDFERLLTPEGAFLPPADGLFPRADESSFTPIGDGFLDPAETVERRAPANNTPVEGDLTREQGEQALNAQDAETAKGVLERVWEDEDSRQSEDGLDPTSAEEQVETAPIWAPMFPGAAPVSPGLSPEALHLLRSHPFNFRPDEFKRNFDSVDHLGFEDVDDGLSGSAAGEVIAGSGGVDVPGGGRRADTFVGPPASSAGYGVRVASLPPQERIDLGGFTSQPPMGGTTIPQPRGLPENIQRMLDPNFQPGGPTSPPGRAPSAPPLDSFPNEAPTPYVPPTPEPQYRDDSLPSGHRWAGASNGGATADLRQPEQVNPNVGVEARFRPSTSPSGSQGVVVSPAVGEQTKQHFVWTQAQSDNNGVPSIQRPNTVAQQADPTQQASSAVPSPTADASAAATAPTAATTGQVGDAGASLSTTPQADIGRALVRTAETIARIAATLFSSGTGSGISPPAGLNAGVGSQPASAANGGVAGTTGAPGTAGTTMMGGSSGSSSSSTGSTGTTPGGRNYSTGTNSRGQNTISTTNSSGETVTATEQRDGSYAMSL